MVNRGLSLLVTLAAAVLLPACSLLPGTGPKSDAVNSFATAGLRSNTALPYALVDISADTIGFLSQPNVVTFQGEFPDKRPKPYQVAGVGDVLNVSIFEAGPGGLFTPAVTAGARPGNFVDLPAQAVDQEGNIFVPYAGANSSCGPDNPADLAGDHRSLEKPGNRAASRRQPQHATFKRRECAWGRKPTWSASG